MPQIIVPSALRTFTENQSTVEIAGSTIQEILKNLAESYPEVQRHLFDEKNNLRNFVNVFCWRRRHS